MKNLLQNYSRLLFMALIVALGLIITGCADTESSNRAERPWNSPKSWENGLPVGLTEGR